MSSRFPRRSTLHTLRASMAVMHELGIAESALRAALTEARKADAVQVHRVVVRVGELSGVDPEAFRFAFETIRAGTLAADAALDIEPVPAVARCATCQLEFAAEDGFYGICPECGNPGAMLVRGRELDLIRLEMS